MDFRAYLQESANELNEVLDDILSDWLNEVKELNPKLIPFALAFISVCKGGKRIRGTLVKLGYELTQGVIPAKAGIYIDNGSHIKYGMTDREILKISAAVEILHTSILIHDDVIDKSPMRRGKPTLFKTLGGDHYGISQAISVGDIGLYLPIKIISETSFLDEYKIRALKHISETIINTAWGEVLDVELPHLGGKMEEEDVIALHKLKTAQYSISGPLILGAILAGADEELLGLLRLFGDNLGIAFQIQDDILGVFGDEKSLGKSVSSDVEEGKNTLLLSYAFEHASLKQKKILNKYYGKDKISAVNLDQIKDIFIKSGSLDYSRQKGLKYIDEAKKLIPKISENEKFQEYLRGLADFLIERNY